MPELLDVKRIQQLLRDFDFKKLFIEELGWNHYDEPLPVQIREGEFLLKGIAEKADLSVFIFDAEEFDSDFPLSSVRSKIEAKVTKSFHEHLIIWIDRANERQIWQWVKREKDQPIKRPKHIYYSRNEGLDLIQRLSNLVFTIEDEERGLSILDSAGRVREAFDVEKVTKKFYDRFQKEHSVFMKFLNGIPDEEMERWYVSVMLNRLMFIYFIQKKGFLDGNLNYLRDKLELFQDGDNGNYYKDFLCPLFFEGFAKNADERTNEINVLLGTIPYLDGGLFLKHQIEEQFGEKIEIADDAFKKLFDFFEDYSWHLDVRKNAKGDEINPDVLGHIFEKYINQKQMGAYYTKEDITKYISKNTILPFLFDRAEEKCKIAFEGEKSVWNILKKNPDDYIYEAVRKGTDLALPEEIEAGINDVSERTGWNKTALEEYALPTEIWREVVARRERYEEVKAKILNGEIRSINDFITYNLDIRQFAQDVIETCEGPELLRAFWHAIVGRIPEKSNEKFEHGITVLDPTCGSGAFLFAALNILEPLYEACIDRMEIFIDEAKYAGGDGESNKYSDFKKVLESINKHPNRDYFIFKSIILNNLYGVDIMEEAVEICKLRLFLKLVAQINDVSQIEPLPDIDFNIRAGNTLVGYVSSKDTKRGVAADLFAGKNAVITMEKITQELEEIDSLFHLFKEVQLDNDPTGNDLKNTLKSKLSVVDEKLNKYLAGEYGIQVENENNYSKWLHSHKPFHWFVKFYGIMNKGGFDVIIGNPPFVEFSKIKNNYSLINIATQACGNLYAYILEKSISVQSDNGRLGLIVPLASFSTDRMIPLQNLFFSSNNLIHLSNYESTSNPTTLFVGVKIQLSILLANKKYGNIPKIFTTNYIRAFSDEREFLFYLIKYSRGLMVSEKLSRIYLDEEKSIIKKLYQNHGNIGNSVIKSGKQNVYFRSMGNFFFKLAFLEEPQYFKNDILQSSSTVDHLTVLELTDKEIITAVINSTLFYYYWIQFSDCYHLSKKDIKSFPLNLSTLDPSISREIISKCKIYLDELEKLAIWQEEFKKDGTKRKYRRFFPQKAKPLINEVDKIFGKHFGFSDTELDFIINYDIKYRMGKNIS